MPPIEMTMSPVGELQKGVSKQGDTVAAALLGAPSTRAAAFLFTYEYGRAMAYA